MKIFFKNSKLKSVLKWAKVGTGSAIFGLVATMQMVGMSTPANAIGLYATQTGHTCSKCHTRAGLAAQTYQHNGFGRRVKQYRQLNGKLPRYAYKRRAPVAPPPFNPPPVAGPPPFNPPPVARRWTCRQAQAHLRNNAYSRISVLDCRGSTYKFTATQTGRRYSLSLKSANGRIFNIRQIRRPVAPPPFNPPVAAPPVFNPPPVARRWTCRQAQAHLRNNAYSRISVRDCRGTVYQFTATQSGRRYSLSMKSANGRIYNIRQIRRPVGPPVFVPPPVVGPPPVFNPPPVRRRLTCRQAKGVLINQGYSRIQTRDCRGRNYSFDANRGGQRFNIKMRSANGQIYRTRRLQAFNPAPPPVFQPPVPRPPVIRGKLSCNQAARKIRNLGYTNVTPRDCSGGRYTFFGKNRGTWFRLRIRASNGHVYKITRQRP